MDKRCIGVDCTVLLDVSGKCFQECHRHLEHTHTKVQLELSIKPSEHCPHPPNHRILCNRYCDQGTFNVLENMTWGLLYQFTTLPLITAFSFAANLLQISCQDNHTPILIGCPLHGLFRLRPRDHLQRRLGCPKCGQRFPGSVHGSAAALLKSGPSTLGQHLLQSYAVADDIAEAAVTTETWRLY